MRRFINAAGSLVALAIAGGCGGGNDSTLAMRPPANKSVAASVAPSQTTTETESETGGGGDLIPRQNDSGSSTPADELFSGHLDNWHQWRGPTANGLAPKGNPPLRWDESTNVKWKVEIPGTGSSTPIVWGNRLFTLTAIKTARKPTTTTTARAADAETNQRGGRRGGRSGRSRMSIPAPTTVYEFVIHCLDRETGETIWQKVANEEVPHEGHHPSHGYASASPTTDGRYL